VKKKLAFLAAPVFMLAASSNAQAHWGTTPYVGADIQFRDMDFQSGFGDNLFSHHHPQGNVYLGAKLHEYFGVEAGFESTTRQNKKSTLRIDSTNLGLPVTTAVSKYNVTSLIRGSHLSLVGFFPVCDQRRLTLIGLAGAAALKASFKVVNFYTNTGVLAPMQEFNKRKIVLRLGAGLEHMFACHWGLRGTVIWENTRKISAPTVSSAALVKPKDSLIYSLGVFTSF
jgi:opacity protein-like surface antigen